jgi:hypothetical protein
MNAFGKVTSRPKVIVNLLSARRCTKCWMRSITRSKPCWIWDVWMSNTLLLAFDDDLSTKTLCWLTESKGNRLSEVPAVPWTWFTRIIPIWSLTPLVTVYRGWVTSSHRIDNFFSVLLPRALGLLQKTKVALWSWWRFAKLQNEAKGARPSYLPITF